MPTPDPIVKRAQELPRLKLTLRAVYNQACLHCSLSRGLKGVDQDEHLARAWALLLDAAHEPTIARRARLDPSLDPLRKSRFGDKFRARFREAELSSPRGGLVELRVVGKHAKALQGLGITTVRQLREELASPSDQMKIAEELGLSLATVSLWRNISELIEEVKFDLGVRSANLLTDVGIFSLKDLAAVEDAAELRKQLVDANAATPRVVTVVGTAVVQAWIKAAQEATTRPKARAAKSHGQ